jgi:hypothetical protein
VDFYVSVVDRRVVQLSVARGVLGEGVSGATNKKLPLPKNDMRSVFIYMRTYAAIFPPFPRREFFDLRKGYSTPKVFLTSSPDDHSPSLKLT